MPKTRRRPKRLRRTNSTALALAALGVAAITAIIFITARPAPTQSKPAPPLIQIASDHDTVQIPTPSRPVARGEKISNVPFIYVNWPKSRLSDEYITSTHEYREAIAATPLPKLLPVPLSALTNDPLDKNAVVEGIPEGMRAITVRVDVESAVEGWARSGNRVDVILIRASRTDGAGLESRVIAENVKILSAGRSTAPLSSDAKAPKAPGTVTLLTSQEDALKIKTAANIGKLTFALRGTSDDAPAITIAMNQNKLLGSSPQIETETKEYTGYAKDAKGRTYVLAGDRRWIKSDEEVSIFAAQEAEVNSQETQANASEEETSEEQ